MAPRILTPSSTTASGVVHSVSTVESVSALVASDLPNTAVTPGSYTSTDITVDQQGRITAAANGTPGGGGTVTNTGTLTADKAIIGNGGVDVKVSALTGIIKQSSGVQSAATDGADYLSPTTGWTLIEQKTPSATGTTTFSSLGSYTHLEIRWSVRSDKAASAVEDLAIQFNADTGGNYDSELIYNATASTTAAFEQRAGTSGLVGIVPAASATANRAGGGTIAIADYRGTTFNKVAVAVSHAASGTTAGTINTRTLGVTWRDASAITSVTVFLPAGNYVSGCKLTAYGLP